MLPLLALHTDAPPFLDEVKKAADKRLARRESAGGELRIVPVPKPPATLPEAVQAAKERAERVAAEELRKAAQIVESTDDSPSTDDDENSQEYDAEGRAEGVYEEFEDDDDDDDGFARRADKSFDDDEPADELEMNDIEDVIRYEDLLGVLQAMEKAYDKLVETVNLDSPEASAMVGIATRLKADMGLLRGLLRAMPGSDRGPLIRVSKGDLAKINDQLGMSNRPSVVQNWQSMLSVVGMLLLLLTLYYGYSFRDTDEPERRIDPLTPLLGGRGEGFAAPAVSKRRTKVCLHKLLSN